MHQPFLPSVGPMQFGMPVMGMYGVQGMQQNMQQ